MASGSADNTLRLWSVQTGRCLYTWEFPTAVKSVAFSEDDDQVVCITEQRMGFQSALRVFNINREGDGTERAPKHALDLITGTESCLFFLLNQNRKSLLTHLLRSGRKRKFARSRVHL